MQRYFATNEHLKLSRQDIHHITNVMRMRPNDKIEVVYNKEVYLCHINSITSDDVSIVKDERLIQADKNTCYITVALGLIKEQKFDFVLQKLTELGANKIIPLKMERSVVKIESNKVISKLERWQRICKEASEQAHLNEMPIVGEITNLDGIEDDYDLKIVCSLSKDANKIKEVLSNVQNCGRILVVVGPEGGITDKEEQMLVYKKFIRVSLGSNILRSETTPIYILSVLNYELMR